SDHWRTTRIRCCPRHLWPNNFPRGHTGRPCPSCTLLCGCAQESPTQAATPPARLRSRLDRAATVPDPAPGPAEYLLADLAARSLTCRRRRTWFRGAKTAP